MAKIDGGFQIKEMFVYSIGLLKFSLSNYIVLFSSLGILETLLEPKNRKNCPAFRYLRAIYSLFFLFSFFFQGGKQKRQVAKPQVPLSLYFVQELIDVFQE